MRQYHLQFIKIDTIQKSFLLFLFKAIIIENKPN